jgi:hypothetical protein
VPINRIVMAILMLVSLCGVVSAQSGKVASEHQLTVATSSDSQAIGAYYVRAYKNGAYVIDHKGRRLTAKCRNSLYWPDGLGTFGKPKNDHDCLYMRGLLGKTVGEDLMKQWNETLVYSPLKGIKAVQAADYLDIVDNELVEGDDKTSEFTTSLVTLANPPRKDIPTIAKGSKGAIVTIVMADGEKPIARGTGFLVRADGAIVTNYHVIATGNVAVVKFSDGTISPVDGVLATDKVRDLAIIKIHGKAFRTLTLGNSDQIQVGEEVVAIGNPLGLELTVSNGILSGIRTDEKEGGKLLQVTAPISHGSSGGPLFNMSGQVIGINFMYLEGGENLNFAIPVNDAKLLVEKRSATLRSFPNEPDSATPNAKAETPSQKQSCNEQAARFIKYNGPHLSDDSKFITEFVSHFDTNSGRCFVESGFTGVVRKAYYIVNGEAQLRDVPQPYSSWEITIYDASSEGTKVPVYGRISIDKGCHIFPEGHVYRFPEISGDDPGGIECRSKEEFDDLALRHFGIITLTKIVPMAP